MTTGRIDQPRAAARIEQAVRDAHAQGVDRGLLERMVNGATSIDDIAKQQLRATIGELHGDLQEAAAVGDRAVSGSAVVDGEPERAAASSSPPKPAPKRNPKPVVEVPPAGLNAFAQSAWYGDRLRAHGYTIAPPRDDHALVEITSPSGDAFFAHPDDFPVILRGQKPPRRDRRTGVKTDPPPPPPPAPPVLGKNEGTPRAFNLTDLGNSERLVHEHGHDLRFVPQIGWHAWDTRRWRPDGDGEVHRRAKLVAREIAKDAFENLEGDKRDKQLAWGFKTEARPRLEAMVALAQTDTVVVAHVQALDRDPYQLNVLNGTLDLATGRLHAHARADQITKLAPVDHEPGADCPIWRGFLDQIFHHDQDLIRFVQRAVGYTLTGSTAEQKLFLLHGRGQNGKTTFLELVRDLIGDYAQQAPAEMLMQQTRARGGATPDLARLPGARFVGAVETGEGRRLDEPLVKQLTGGDRIAARPLYKAPFEFVPTHKLWIATNHLPQIAGTDDAIWRRIRLIPFTVRIPDDARDNDLPQKLRAELSGILNWAVDGCSAYLVDGLGQPAAVSAATQAYRDDMDELGAFLEECADIEKTDAAVKASVLFTRYGYWAQAVGASPITATAFGRALTERGFQKTKRNDGVYYLGIDIASGQTELN